MRFVPDEVEVRLGETVRFVVSNDGRMMHEFVIGTQSENKAHAELMLKYPNMEHEAAHMAHVAPGGEGEVVWHFNRPGEFEFACLIVGHYQAGMDRSYPCCRAMTSFFKVSDPGGMPCSDMRVSCS